MRGATIQTKKQNHLIFDELSWINPQLLLSSIFESIQDGFSIIDTSYNVIRVNQTIEKRYQLNMPLIGKKCYEAFRGFCDPCQPCVCFDAINSSKPGYRVSSIRFHGKDEDSWLESFYYPLMDAETKETRGVIIYSRDITEIKKIQKEIERLEDLNLIGQMAASIGHEIRNPMTTVRGYLQLFLLNAEFIKYKEQLEIMVQELDRANSIISEFLSMAKNKHLNIKVSNLNTTLNNLKDLILARTMAAGINLVLDLTNIPDIPYDENEIRKLILNLTFNGIEAMSLGDTLKVSTVHDNNKVILAVEDEGTGIPGKIKENLGKPFYTTKDKGTGLGLAICYSVAARHNAMIDYVTGPGGTTFYVKFPYP